MTTIFDPIQLGADTAANRAIMAPLTRGRATRDHDDLAKDRGGLKRLVLPVVDSALPIEELVKALR